MGRADIISPQTAPPCIHPQRGKVCKHSVKSPMSKSCGVLNECVAGSYFPKNAGELCP
jgi:hypothetical protein